MKVIRIINLIMLLISLLFLSFLIGHNIGLDKRDDTHQCKVKELELQKEIEELKWRYELVNEIKK